MTLSRLAPGPTEHLLLLLRLRLHWISDRGWTAIMVLLADQRVGHQQLACRLKREGLPPYGDLASWLTLLRWLSAWETRGDSFGMMGAGEGLNPACLCRMSNRLLGLTWTEVCDHGLAWAIDRFVLACRPGP